MSEQTRRDVEPIQQEIFIGCDSFGNEISVVSERPLGKVEEVNRKTESHGDSPSDQFTYVTKEIRFEDGEKEVACKFITESTGSVASETTVDTIEYLSPDAKTSEVEKQS